MKAAKRFTSSMEFCCRGKRKWAIAMSHLEVWGSPLFLKEREGIVAVVMSLDKSEWDPNTDGVVGCK